MEASFMDGNSPRARGMAGWRDLRRKGRPGERGVSDQRPALPGPGTRECQLITVKAWLHPSSSLSRAGFSEHNFLSPEFPIRECKVPDPRNYFCNSNNAFYMLLFCLPISHLSSTFISFYSGSRELALTHRGLSEELVCSHNPFPQPRPHFSLLLLLPDQVLPRFCCWVLFWGCFEFISGIHRILKGKITGALNLEVRGPKSVLSIPSGPGGLSCRPLP